MHNLFKKSVGISNLLHFQRAITVIPSFGTKIIIFINRRLYKHIRGMIEKFCLIQAETSSLRCVMWLAGLFWR